MHKYRLIIVVLFIIAFLTSCTTDESLKNESGTIITNQNINDFTDYNFKNSSLKIVEEDDNFYFYKNIRPYNDGEFEINQYKINLNDSKRII